MALTAGVASKVRHHDKGSTLATSAGEISALLVVDATGHDPVLVRRPPVRCGVRRRHSASPSR